MDRVFAALAQLIERALAVAFVFAVTLNFANVVDRYVLNASILSADEIQIYIMIWVTFLGSVVVTWQRRHLRMDVLRQMLPPALQKLLHAIELLLVVTLGGFTAFYSFDYAARMYAIGRASDTAGIPLWTVHAALPLGFGLMAAICLWRLLAWRAGGREPVERTPGVSE